MNVSIRRLALLVLIGVLVFPAIASAHGGVADGHTQTFTQVLGPYELAITLGTPTTGAGPLLIDILPQRDPVPRTITLRAALRGQSFEGKPVATVEPLVGPQGVYYTQLEVDQPGAWELDVSTEGADGVGHARIPFTISTAPLPPFLIPLSLSLGSVALTMVIGIIGGAVARGRNQELPRWFDQITGAALLAGIAATAIFGGQQWNDQQQRALASSPDAPILYGSPHANLSISTFPALPQANQPMTLTLDLSDGGTGLPVDDLVSHHEALLHLVLLDQTGAFMTHIHPPRIAPGSYAISFTPDRPGRYTAYAEIAREASGTQVLARDFVVDGLPVTVPDSAPGFGVRQLDDVEINVTSTNPEPRAKQQVVFTFSFRKEGQPFTDLQPWLGMGGHMFTRSSDQMIFAHIHAVGPMAPSGPTVTGVRYGPEVRFVYTFPQPGRYQVWAQFRRENQILTVPLTLEVQP